MRRPRIAICNLSPLHIVEDETGQRRLPQESEYAFIEDDLQIAYKGVQTNQAPVKCLLERAARKDDAPVTLLVNLYSAECEKQLEPYINEFGDLDTASAEQFFVDSVVFYCEEEGIPCPEFERLEYDTKNPANSLAKLVELIKQPNAIVDVDVTGGLRDAATLVALALQTIRANPFGGKQGIEVGRIVYSNNKDKTITHQADIYELADLSNAINAFTIYGKADQLCDFFSGKQVSPEILDLCNSLRVFSERMSLCNTQLKGTVDRVQRLLNSIEEKPAEELLPSELLFASLIPSFRNGFVSNDKKLIVRLIKWCAERQLYQQALSLVRERIPEYLVSIGAINLFGEADASDLEQLCFGKNREKGTPIVDEDELNRVAPKPKNFKDHWYYNKHIRACLEEPARCLNSDYATIKADKEHVVSEALIWFRYLWIVRNLVVHADPGSDYAFKQLCSAFPEKQQAWSFLRLSKGQKNPFEKSLVPQAQTADNLMSDIQQAIRCFEKV